jgi:hypothetical protein
MIFNPSKISKNIFQREENISVKQYFKNTYFKNFKKIFFKNFKKKQRKITISGG